MVRDVARHVCALSLALIVLVALNTVKTLAAAALVVVGWSAYGIYRYGLWLWKDYWTVRAEGEGREVTAP
jgi:hypothetical protein